MKAKGPGKGHVRLTPQTPSPRCVLCGQFIFEMRALSVNGRWQHRPDQWGRCPAPLEDEPLED